MRTKKEKWVLAGKILLHLIGLRFSLYVVMGIIIMISWNESNFVNQIGGGCEFGEIPVEIPSGSEILTFHNSMPAMLWSYCFLPSQDFYYGDFLLKGDEVVWLNYDKRVYERYPQIESGILAEDTVIDGESYAAGTRVYFDSDGNVDKEKTKNEE